MADRGARHVVLALAATLLQCPAEAVRPSSLRMRKVEAERRQLRAAFLVANASSAKLEGSEDPKTLADYCKGGPPQIKTDARVEANWNDLGTYYPGTVKEINDDKTIDILYDDGWTEKNLAQSDVKPVPTAKKEVRQKLDDPACDVAKDLEDLKKRVSKAQDDIGLFSASKRAKLAEGRGDRENAKKASAQATSAAPAAAPASAPAAAPMPAMTSEELEELKRELAEVDEEIAEVQHDVDENDKVLKENEASSEEAAGPKVLTMDDLIIQYKERIAERRRQLERLKARRRQQQQQLVRLGALTVSLEDIEKEVNGIFEDVEKIRRKRNEIQAAGRLDVELKASIDQLIAQAQKLQSRLKALIEAERLASEQRAAMDAAKRKAAELKRELEAAERDAEKGSAADKDRARELARRQSEAEAEAEAKARAAEAEGDKKVLEAAEEMENELKSVEKKTAGLDTDVFPKGHKWWRYRYEHAFVEGVLMVFICLLMVLWEWIVKGVRNAIYTISHQKHHDVLEFGTMYIHWLEQFLGELVACLLVFLTVWLLSLWGFFHWFPHYLHSMHGMHLPNTGEQYRHIAFDQCVVLVFSLILYFALVFSVVHKATAKMKTWAELEVGCSTSSEDSDEGSEEASPTSSPRSPSTQGLSGASSPGGANRVSAKDRAAAYRRPEARVSARRSSIEIIRKMTVAASESDYSRLKDYFLREMDSRIPNFGTSHFSFWKYLRICVRSTVDSMFMFGPLVWLPIVVTFVILVYLHIHRLSYLRIMGFFLVVAVINLLLMMKVIVAVNQRLDESILESQSFMEDDSGSGEAQDRRKSFSPVSMECMKVMFAILCSYTLFFLCFGAARTICQTWMWELFFWPVFGVACVTALICLFFIFKVAPMVPVFAASIALPPYVDEANIMRVKEIMKHDHLGAREYSKN